MPILTNNARVGGLGEICPAKIFSCTVCNRYVLVLDMYTATFDPSMNSVNFSLFLQVYRIYSNNQEYEMFRVQDTLQPVPNETKMVVRLGRALKPGEFRVKLSLLEINEPEFFKPRLDSIVAKGMTVRPFKEQVVEEAYEQGVDVQLNADR